MKKSVTISVLNWSALLLCCVSLSSQAKQPTTAAAAPVVVLVPFLLDNPDFFELTESQKVKVAQVTQTSGNKREGLDQLILDLRAELREEMLKLTPNDQLITKLRDELLKQEAARLQLSIDCAKGLRQALTPAQWKTLLELANQ